MWTEAIIQAVESDVRLRLAQVIERQGRIILSAPGSSSANAPSLVISGVSIPESDQWLGVLFVRQAEEVGDSIWSSIPMNEGVREIVPGGILGRLLLDGAKFFCHGPDQLRWEGLPESNRPAPWFVAENSAYRVTAATVGGISYSLAHNRIPIIKQFWIEPLADAMPPESLSCRFRWFRGWKRSRCGRSSHKSKPARPASPWACGFTCHMCQGRSPRSMSLSPRNSSSNCVVPRLAY